MIIESPVLGSVTVSEERMYTFAGGIPGFEEYRKFVIIQEGDQTPFAYLQCVDEPNLILLVANPFVFYPEYDFEISDAVVQTLAIQDREDVVVWSVVTASDSLESATINLLAPVIVNQRTMQGKQVILTNREYKTKHPLLAAAGEDRMLGGDTDARTEP